MKTPSYEMKLKSETKRGREVYKFLSADGVPAKDSFRDAELTLVDTVKPNTDDDIL